jgi:adenosylcobinamide kinase/adenosylcobinamide-phosphate guanylyltransferase
MTSAITLVLGGARSGKSDWAQRRAEQSGQPVVFLAAATAGDAEMAERIATHQSSRPAHWRTIESAERLVAMVRQQARPGDLVLIDCLTLWVSNVILSQIGTADVDAVPGTRWTAIERDLTDEIAELVDLARAMDLSLVLVSNEVGMGIVPAYPLGRRYRDILGQVNRAAAARADAVILMIAGLAVDLRRLALPDTTHT